MAGRGRRRIGAAVVWDELHRGRPAGAVLSVVLAAAIMVLDVVEGSKTQYVGLLVATPLMAASFVPPFPTALAGAAALLFGGLYGAYENVAYTSPQIVRLLLIVGATLLAVVVSAYRVRREDELAELAVVAEVAQHTVLRPLPDSVAGVDVAVAYLSSATAARIGGDLYEVVDTPWGVRMLLGDVRGKGLDAVRLASHLLGSFRHVVQTEPDLDVVVQSLDRAVSRESGEEDFVTAVVVEVAEGSRALTILNCGHPAPIGIRDGHTRALAPPRPSLPLGLGADPPPLAARLEPGEAVLLYTDGLDEARSGESWFDVPAALRAAWGSDGLEPSLARLQEAVTAFVGGRIDDDIALVAFRCPPAHSGSALDLAAAEPADGRRHVDGDGDLDDAAVTEGMTGRGRR